MDVLDATDSSKSCHVLFCGIVWHSLEELVVNTSPGEGWKKVELPKFEKHNIRAE